MSHIVRDGMMCPEPTILYIVTISVLFTQLFCYVYWL